MRAWHCIGKCAFSISPCSWVNRFRYERSTVPPYVWDYWPTNIRIHIACHILDLARAEKKRSLCSRRWPLAACSFFSISPVSLIFCGSLFLFLFYSCFLGSVSFFSVLHFFFTVLEFIHLSRFGVWCFVRRSFHLEKYAFQSHSFGVYSVQLRCSPSSISVNLSPQKAFYPLLSPPLAVGVSFNCRWVMFDVLVRYVH